MISRLIAEGEAQCAELHGRPLASPSDPERLLPDPFSTRASALG